MKNLITGTTPSNRNRNRHFVVESQIGTPWWHQQENIRLYQVHLLQFYCLLFAMLHGIYNITEPKQGQKQQSNTTHTTHHFRFSLCTCMKICIYVITTRYKFVLVSVVSQHAITENESRSRSDQGHCFTFGWLDSPICYTGTPQHKNMWTYCFWPRAGRHGFTFEQTSSWLRAGCLTITVRLHPACSPWIRANIEKHARALIIHHRQAVEQIQITNETKWQRGPQLPRTKLSWTPSGFLACEETNKKQYIYIYIYIGANPLSGLPHLPSSRSASLPSLSSSSLSSSQRCT